MADDLIEKGQSTTNDSQRYSYLSQANLIAYRDPKASNALAKFWIDRGEYKKAIDIYLSNIKDPNYSALGILALKARDYGLALKYFSIASDHSSTAESRAGEAVSLYNLDRVDEGCGKANEAIKLNLQSKFANQAVESCILLGGSQSDTVRSVDVAGQSERSISYKLLDALVFEQGEQKLADIQEKTALDYLLWSKLLASKGDIKGAIDKVEQGIGIDKSIADMYVHAIKLYELEDDKAKVQQYQQRLDQLKFQKYQ